MGFWDWITWKSKPPLLGGGIADDIEIPMPPCLPPKSEELPYQATHTHSFRTIAFSSPERDFLGSTYLQAVYKAETKKWALRTVTARSENMEGDSDDPAHDPIEIIEPFEGANISFFFEDAVKTLAKYERERNNPNYMFDIAEKDALGFSHFIAFAKREKWIFDLDGVPRQLEANGELPTGKFRQADIKFLQDTIEREAAEQEQAEQAHKQKMALIFNGSSSETFVSSLMPAQVASGTLDAVIQTIKQKETLSSIIESLNHIQSLWTKGLEKGFNYKSYFDDEVGFYVKIYPHILEIFNKIEEKSLSLSNATNDSFRQGLYTCRLAFAISVAQQTINFRQTKEGFYEDYHVSIDTAVEESKDILQEIWMDSQAAAMEATILRGLKENPSEIPAIILNFIRACARVEAEFQDRALAIAEGKILLPQGDSVLRDVSLGESVPGKGVYLGVWEPKDNSGRTLGKIFDIYAAPEDLRKGSGNLLLTFNNAVKHVASLRNFHSHDGGNFRNEKAILDAVRRNPASLEKWFIPTKELLDGKTSGGNKIQPANLYDSREKGSFKNTFITKSGSGNARCYWSATEPAGFPSHVCVVDFTGGAGVWVKDGNEMSSRVVRAEMRP